MDIKVNKNENSLTTKVSQYITSSFAMSAISSSKIIEKRHYKYIAKDCRKLLQKSLREYKTKIINLKKKKMKLLTNEQPELPGIAKICYI